MGFLSSNQTNIHTSQAHSSYTWNITRKQTRKEKNTAKEKNTSSMYSPIRPHGRKEKNTNNNCK
jgi:hypothetical protein